MHFDVCFITKSTRRSLSIQGFIYLNGEIWVMVIEKFALFSK